MTPIKTALVILSMMAATNALANNNHRSQLVKMSCPPLSALKHAGAGSPWVLDQQSVDAGFYVVQDLDAVDSNITSFEKMYGGLSVYFADRKHASPLEVTCRYESGKENVVYVKSVHIYDPWSVIERVNEFPNQYIGHDQQGVVECAKGFANGSFGDDNERLCQWEAYVIKAK